METKACRRCKEEKDVVEFNKKNAHKDGLDSYCRKCAREASREWYSKNAERSKASSIAWQKRNPDKWKEITYRANQKYRFGGKRGVVLERDKHQCTICGTSENLVVHHIDGKGRNVKREERNNILENLITACRACHRGIHRNAVC